MTTVATMGTVYEKGSPVESYPIQSSKTAPFFPPVKLRSHWDPTRIYARTVPTTLVPLPLTFRPYTKVCLEYRTSAPEERAPEMPKDLVFPNGGEVYSPTRYLNAIDNESLLRRLDRPLGTCDPEQYQPPRNGDMYVDRMLVPTSRKPPSRFVEEISMPQALLRTGAYTCRQAADQKNWDRSAKLFNNSTKQDRYRAPLSVEPPRMDRSSQPGQMDQFKQQNIWKDTQRCNTSLVSAHPTNLR